MNYRIFSLLFLFFSLNGIVVAQPGERGLVGKKDSSTNNGSTYAIIIGISDYKLVPDLQYAHKDAQAFEQFLLTGAGGKVVKENIETFLNENATRNNVGDAISVVARKAKSGDRVYFFFAGHGDMEDLTQIENGLLLLYNSPNGNYFGMNDDVLEILDLKRYLSPLSQKGVEMIFIVDACHSGNLTGGVEGVRQTGTALMSSWGKEYKILSCQPDQLSLESAEYGGGRGLFSLELEEGMKGLADTDGNGRVTMFELQSYIQANVAKYSEFKQIPMVSGDLSKSFFKVDPLVLAALRKEKEQNYPMLASVNTKGGEERLVDSLDPAGKKVYYSFKKNIDEKKFIYPDDTNALHDYRLFVRKYKNNPLAVTMRRNLAAGLNEKFNSIVGPLLKSDTSFSTRDECYYAAAELDSCLSLLGKQHYMYNNIKARKLFMDAMSLTWALSEKEYNISLKPAVEKAIKFLEQSEKLEPNASYTVYALAIDYFYVYEYDKAFTRFQKYIDLRPYDFGAKYSLALTYRKLKQFAKAEELFEKLLQNDEHSLLLHSQLFETYFAADMRQKALEKAIYIRDSIDKYAGYYLSGVYYAKVGELHNAVFNYQQARLYGDMSITDNNTGHVYFVKGMLDSARYYFDRSIAEDTSSPFALFNLATLEAINGDYSTAMNRFAKSVDYTTSFTEAFLSHLDKYFGKHYTVKDSSLFEEFRQRTFVYDLQWLGFVSILYCYLRHTELIFQPSSYEYVFKQLFNYKEQDVYSWYHFACYKALNKQKLAALQSLEKSLKLGFSSYFMLTSDDDLASIRNSPEFQKLLVKYFPERFKKK